MKTFGVAAALVATALASPSPVQNLAARASGTSSGSLPTITTKGNAFFAGTSRFYIRGIDWQPGGSSNLVDPIAQTTTCQRDIAEFKKLGVNTVRIYTVDNTANHDVCMQALADAGIYLVLDVNSPLYSINRADPAPSYNAVYLQNVFATIDAFASYTNTLAFFSANEVINDGTTTAAAKYVKAVTRDMRQYLGSRGYRKIPVGYSAADVAENRMQMAQYMNCGTDDERSDFFAFNDYSWCNPSSFTKSGWDQKVKNFTGYGLPIFLSEYGCNIGRLNSKTARTFEETAALYSTQMTGVYSGGLVYEYSEEGSSYGLVNITSDGKVTELEDFQNLMKVFAANAVPTGDGGYSSTSTASTCPPKSNDWNITSNALPAIPSAAAAYMTSGAGKGVGFTGTGSQNAGGTSTGDAQSGSGAVTATAAATSKSAAAPQLTPFDPAPFFIGAVTFGFSILGAFML